MALVLTVGGVADFLCERVIGVLERAHHRRVHAYVERFKAIEIARRVEEAIECVGVGTLRGGEAGDSARGFGDDTERVGGVVDKARSFAVQLEVKSAGKEFTDDRMLRDYH